MRKMLILNKEDSCIKIYQNLKFLPHNFILKKKYFYIYYELLVRMKQGPNSATFPAVPSRLARTFKFHSPEVTALAASPSTTPMRHVPHPRKVNVTEIWKSFFSMSCKWAHFNNKNNFLISLFFFPRAMNGDAFIVFRFY